MKYYLFFLSSYMTESEKAHISSLNSISYCHRWKDNSAIDAPLVSHIGDFLPFCPSGKRNKQKKPAMPCSVSGKLLVSDIFLYYYAKFSQYLWSWAIAMENKWNTMKLFFEVILVLGKYHQLKKKKKREIRKSCRSVLCNTRSQVSILQLDLKQLRHTTVLLLQLCPMTVKDPYFSAPRGLDPKGTVPIHNCSVSLQVLSACPELHL